MAKRIQYLDALRGFTMFLVILVHVAYLTSFKCNDLFINVICSKFRMPLFFFVSGFVFYKPDRNWDFSTIYMFLKKKIPVQVVTPAIFMALYFFIKDIDFQVGIFDSSKCGYWFTFGLFEFFIIYIVSDVLLDFMRLSDEYARDIMLILISFAVSTFQFETVHRILGISEKIAGLLGLVNFTRYPYFVFGTIARRNFKLLDKFLGEKLTMAICSTLFAVVYVCAVKIDAPPLLNMLFGYILGVSGIISMFYLFHKFQYVFDMRTKIGNVMQYVGRRTLDLYLFHFFVLLAVDSLIIKPIVIFYGETLSKLVVGILSLILSVLVVVCCLLVSKIIRLIPFVDRWMFGSKIIVSEDSHSIHC